MSSSLSQDATTTAAKNKFRWDDHTNLYVALVALIFGFLIGVTVGLLINTDETQSAAQTATASQVIGTPNIPEFSVPSSVVNNYYYQDQDQDQTTPTEPIPSCPSGFIDPYGSCELAPANSYDVPLYDSYIPSDHQAFIVDWGFEYHEDGVISQTFNGTETIRYDEVTHRFATTIDNDDEFYFEDTFGQPIYSSSEEVCYSSSTPRVYGLELATAAVFMACDQMK